jgi:hypothetical protein
LKQFYLHGKGDREIADHLTRKQAIDFLVHCGYNKKKVTAMSDDSLLTAFDIAKRKEKQVSDKCPNCGGTHEDTMGVCPDVIEHRYGGGDEEYSGEREGGEWLDAKGKKDSGVRIIKGVNGWRIEDDTGKILFDKVFNDQLEAFAFYKQNKYSLNAKQFSMYGSKWKVVEKGKHTVMLRNKKGETLTITRDEYEQYRPRTIPTGEAIESVINAKGVGYSKQKMANAVEKIMRDYGNKLQLKKEDMDFVVDTSEKNPNKFEVRTDGDFYDAFYDPSMSEEPYLIKETNEEFAINRPIPNPYRHQDQLQKLLKKHGWDFDMEGMGILTIYKE